MHHPKKLYEKGCRLGLGLWLWLWLGLGLTKNDSCTLVKTIIVFCYKIWFERHRIKYSFLCSKGIG